MTNLRHAKELGLFHTCFSSDIKVSSCWHSSKFSKLLTTQREPKTHLLLLLRVWKLVASFYPPRDFLQDFLQSPSCLTRETLHRTLPEKTIGSTPDQNELLTSNHSDHSMGLFSSKAQNLSMACIFVPVLWYIFQLSGTCIMFKLLWYITVQLPVPCLKKECKSLGSTAPPSSDMVPAETEGDRAWGNSYSTSSSGAQRLRVKAWLRKPIKASQWTQWKPLLGRGIEQQLKKAKFDWSERLEDFSNSSRKKVRSLPSEDFQVACKSYNLDNSVKVCTPFSLHILMHMSLTNNCL